MNHTQNAKKILITFTVFWAAVFIFWGYESQILKKGLFLASLSEFSKKSPDLDEWRKTYPELKQTAIESKPLDLPPLLEHPGQIEQSIVIFPERGWLVGFKPEVVGGPSYLLHHADYLDLSTISEFCREDGVDNLPTPVFSSGKELSSGVLPIGYGYPVKNRSEIFYYVMLHNPDSVEYKNVKIRLNLWYVPGEKTDLTPVTTFYLSVLGPCDDGEFLVPPGREFAKILERPYVSPWGGKVIALGAHIHDFGKYVELKINGKSAEKFVPQTNSDGEITAVETKFPKNMIIQKGDKLTAETLYQNASGKEKDAMSGIFLVVVPEK